MPLRPPSVGWRLIQHERLLTACALAGALVLLALLTLPLWKAQVPVFLDLGCFHLPVRHFYASCLAAGEPFDWLPDMYNGLFITGEGEHGPYHPLHLLLYRCLPLHRAFYLEVFLHYPLMLLGMVFFLRPYVGRPAALLGALVYTFSANNVSHAVHPNYVAVLAHLPWLLGLMDRACLAGPGPHRRLALAGIALMIGSQLLLGHPQTFSYSLLASACHAGFLAFRLRPSWSFWLGLAGAHVLGAAVAAVQLLATLHLLGHSTRAGMDPLFGSLVPSHLAQLVIPSFLSGHTPSWGDEAMYVGAVPLVLGLWLAVAGRRTVPVPATATDLRSAQGPFALSALVLIVLAGWLAIGAQGGLYRVQTMLPLIGGFRAPSRYLNLLAFGLAILAAIAFDRLAGRVATQSKSSWPALALPWLLAGGAAVLALYLRANLPGVQRGFYDRLWSGAVCLALAALSLTLAARGQRVGLAALLLLAAGDLGFFTLRNRLWGETLWLRTMTVDDWTAVCTPPPLPRQGRLLDSSLVPIVQVLRGERLVNGYRGGLEPAKCLDYREATALRLAQAAWYREPNYEPPLRIAGSAPAGDDWHRLADPLPRVRLLSDARVSKTPAADLHAIDVTTTALVSHPLELTPGPGGTADLTADRPGLIRVHVEAPGRQLLVVSESHDPGWQATVDGQPAAVEAVYGDFLGCVVEPGKHEVVFAFRPASIRYGRLISLLGLSAVLLLAGLSLCQLRRTVMVRSRRVNHGLHG
jgi:hypothetical protein